MGRLLRAFAVFVLLIATSVAVTAQPAHASVDDFTFDELSVDYTLTRADDGSSQLLVVERFVARFPDADQNRGIRRAFADTYNGQPLRPRLISVTDENDAPRPSETEHEDGVFGIVSRAPDYLHGLQTFVITYELENVTWVFDDTGLEFFWDVNGVGWQQPFGEVTARLHLDADLAAALTGRMACYEGNQGSGTPCDLIETQTQDGGVVVTARSYDLGARQTLSLAVGFAEGTFETFDTSYLASPFGWWQGVAGLGLIGGVVWAIGSRRRRLADEPGRPTIIAEYTPPPNIDALESAVLLGRATKAIPAEVLEQAVVGSIRIVEGHKKAFGGQRLIAELVDPSLADGDGRMLLDGLFPSGVAGEQYEFGRQDTRLSKVAHSILAAAEKEINQRGLRRSVPFGARAWPIVTVAVSSALVLVFGIAALEWGVGSGWPVVMFIVAGVAIATTIGLVARRPLTAVGAETRDHLRGLQQFIEWAEADRIRMLQSPSGAERESVDVDDPRQKLKLYEKLLPYAVVFGQEKQWSAQLAVLYAATGVSGPYWYAGAGAFDASSFSAGISTLSSAATSSSSTSGGSGGGGGAGGGGGGGGGGGV